MPKNVSKDVKNLNIDLYNYRTVKQKTEKQAIHAMISINADWFWALLDSLLEDGYHPTENIIVHKNGDGQLVVKEGNRRIAALKIALGIQKGIDIPDIYKSKIQKLSEDWIANNSFVPCAIYAKNEEKQVDKVVSLIHAKGEKAGRDKWTAVAKARHERDKKNIATPGLDLLEKYIKSGTNRSPQQAERWAGDYPLTVLDEAIQRLYPKLDFKSVKELAKNYPKKNKRLLDKIMLDIGASHLGFKQVRDEASFLHGYGIRIKQADTPTPDSAASGKTSANTTTKSTQKASHNVTSKAVPSIDPRAVKRTINSFSPKGDNRAKIVTLKNEIRSINIKECPHAFCFLLRSIFELSAKAYCNDCKASGGPKLTDKNGRERSLSDMLRKIVNHLTSNMQNKEKVKQLHGAIAELAKTDGLLSITSMNQLVHHPSFSIQTSDICILFGNIFPLLDAMNS